MTRPFAEGEHAHGAGLHADGAAAQAQQLAGRAAAARPDQRVCSFHINILYLTLIEVWFFLNTRIASRFFRTYVVIGFLIRVLYLCGGGVFIRMT